MRTVSLGILGLFLTAVLTGCGGGVDTDAMFAKANATNAQKAATLYCVFQAQNEWTGPETEAELIEFASGLPKDKLELIGIKGAVDDIFKGRDGQPFKYRFSVRTTPRDSPVPIVFESSATEGTYLVAFTGAKMEEVEQSEYDQLFGTEEKDDDAREEERRKTG